MSTEGKEDSSRAICTGYWRHLLTFMANTDRRARILGHYALACWLQQKIRKATRLLGEKTYQALERGEANPLVAPEVGEAVQRAKDLKDLKDNNYRVIAAIREQIRRSSAVATPEEPGDAEDNPPQP
ncbi:MAG: hypothetical protein ABSC45_04805 [Desulfobaccales bacterium]|jgi:hypothetical protein